MKINLMIPGKPAGKGRPRITKNGVYTPSKTRKFESLIQTVWYQSKAKAAPPDATVFCSINAYFPLPKNASQNRQKRLLNGLYYRGKPDTDNIVKAVLDALNGLAYPDDSAVQLCAAYKLYTNTLPRTEVFLSWEDSTHDAEES